MYEYIVTLNNVKIKARHGLYDDEKTNKQLFEISVKAFFYKKQSCNDNIKETINYEKIYSIIVDIVVKNSFDLIETIGEKIIEKLFLFDLIKKVQVTIKKPEVKFINSKADINTDVKINNNCIEVSIIKAK